MGKGEITPQVSVLQQRPFCPEIVDKKIYPYDTCIRLKLLRELFLPSSIVLRAMSFLSFVELFFTILSNIGDHRYDKQNSNKNWVIHARLRTH